MRKLLVTNNNATQRLILPFSIALLLLVSVGLIAFYEYTLRNDVRAETDRALTRLAGHGHSILISDINQFRDTLYFLHATPPISGLTRAEENNGIDPFDGTAFSQWKGRLETIFVAMLQNNQEIDQLRIIRDDAAGRELVRVDRLTGKIDVIGDQRLQDKRGNDYFEQSTKLQPGELYISRLNLNREFGRIEYPIRPTLRLATPIFFENGDRFGFLIMNVNATFLLDSFRDETGGQFSMILTDDQGYYIDHPMAEYRFSRDLHPERNWLNDYTINQRQSGGGGIATEQGTQTSFVFHSTTVQFSSDPESAMHIYAVAPPSLISDQLWKRRGATYGFAAVILFILVVVLAMFMRGYRNSIRLAEARAKHEAIINGSSDAIIGMELDGQITSWNEAASTLFQVSERTAVGQNITSMSLFPDLNVDEKIQHVQASQSSLELDISFNGNTTVGRELFLTLSPILTENQDLVGIALIANDVTQQRAAERQVRQANTQLEAQVAERTKELAEAHQKAIQASEMKSAFISNVSHEMRTPLNGMIGTLTLIKREPLTDNQAKYLEMAETSSSALATLINDILDLSKIEAGKLDFEEKLFSPIAMLDAVANSTAVRAREKGINIIIDTADVMHSKLCGDANRLKQILNNLINNAIKFTTEGYVAIVASSSVENGQVRLDISVEDSGIGIAESNKHKLFYAFSQEDSSVSANYGGTGLGLSICRQLCKLMNGEIAFESIKGQGSRFFFHVCFDEAGSEPRNITKSLTGKRSLILMDQNKAVQAASRLVACLGSEIIDFSSATLDAQNRQPDLVITDRSNGRLKELCNIISGMTTDEHPYPRLFVVKSDDAKIPEYEGEIVWLASPLTWSELSGHLGSPCRPSEMNETFRIDAPGTKTAISAAKTDVVAAERINVLIVDDNVINQEVAMGLLSETNSHLITASNGLEALEALRQSTKEGRTIHCIAMDCQMPGMDGFEATGKIRSGSVAPQMSDIPIIAMTANAMSGEREKCIAAGMSDYVTKPIEPDIFVEKVIYWSRKRLAKLATA